MEFNSLGFEIWLLEFVSWSLIFIIGVSMFLHLGDDVLVYAQDVIVVLNAQILDNKSKTDVLPKFPEKKIKITSQLKSYIITDKCIYFSPISAATLKKRAKFLKNIPNYWDE